MSGLVKGGEYCVKEGRGLFIGTRLEIRADVDNKGKYMKNGV